MQPDKKQLETLKYILENSLQPQNLDSHPWVTRLIVQDAIKNSPDLQEKSPGQQLIAAIGQMFLKMMPSTTPRRGKRIDTRWGEFGILAAQYFAPIVFGMPSPASLRDSWGRIDASILYFVYNRSDDLLTKSEKERYKLVGNELSVAPISTLSDWHRKGLKRLMKLILTREDYLDKSISTPAALSHGEQSIEPADLQVLAPHLAIHPVKLRQVRRMRLFMVPLLALLMLGLVLLGGLKAWKIYNMGLRVQQEAAALQSVIKAPGFGLEHVKTVGSDLSTLRKDFEILKNEVEPYLWLGPWFNWLPVYGGDLASIEDLVITADAMLTSADISYQAVQPVLDDITDNKNLPPLTPPRLAALLVKAQPQFESAQSYLGVAFEAHNRLKTEDLSPAVADMLKLLPLMQDGITLAMEFPRLLGATDEGPKTYLLLVQNEDELRPTGGFITAAGTLLVRDGKISNLDFENSGNLDDWTKPYPQAPWQLDQYMNSPVLIFRDANWFTNYPTAALYAEYLYSYISDHSVDGVIAFDQQMLVEVLTVIGPIELQDVPYPIDAGNVVAYMRAAKAPTEEDLASPDWEYKAFINKISKALISKLFSGDIPWEQLGGLMIRGLNERHLMIQLDSPAMTSFLALHHWDGAVRAPLGDYLMIVDTNVGYNKTNAVVESSLDYDVDLTEVSAPVGSLTVIHKNNAVGSAFCRHWYKDRVGDENIYPVNDCYWNYLRVYKPQGTTLLDATPQSIPASWMIRNQQPPSKIDVLDEEMEGIQAFGTIQVVPKKSSLSVNFQFALPSEVLVKQPGSDQMIYRILVQKQPGTLAIPLTIRVHIPLNAVFNTVPQGSIIDGNHLLIRSDLRQDVDFEVIFDLK